MRLFFIYESFSEQDPIVTQNPIRIRNQDPVVTQSPIRIRAEREHGFAYKEKKEA